MSGKEDQIIPYTDSQATLEKFKALGGETKSYLSRNWSYRFPECFRNPIGWTNWRGR